MLNDTRKRYGKMDNNGNSEIKELILEMTEQLNNRFPLRQTDNTPVTPMVIMYMGDYASVAQRSITAVMRKLWRTRVANYIPQLICKSIDEEYELSRIDPDKGTLVPLDEYALEDMIDEAQEHDECFRNMQELLLCTVECVKDCDDINKFMEMFRTVGVLKEEAGIPNCRTIRFLLLDESAHGKRLSREVRNVLSECIETLPNNEIIILLSNRLRGGALLRGGREERIYQLIGSMIILANSESGDFRNGINLFLAGNQSCVLTASYSRLERPNRKIAEIVLLSTVKWLQAHMRQEVSLDYLDICKKLRITAGTMQYIERFFENSILQSLPPVKIVEYLPRRSSKMNELSQMPFKAFREETFGVFDSFISRLSAFDGNTEKKFRIEFREHLQEAITEAEAASSLSDKVIADLISELRRDPPDEQIQVEQYLKSFIKYEFVNRFLSVCEEEMRRYRDESQGHVNLLDHAVELIQDMSILVTDDAHLRQFYTSSTHKFLDNYYGERFLDAYNDCEGNIHSLCQVIQNMFSAFLVENRIFSLPLEEELAERMQGEHNSFNIVNTELLSDVVNRISLQTLAPLGSYYQIVMGNRYDEKGNVTTIAGHLERTLSETHTFMYFDTGDRNLLEAIMFYKVDPSNLPIS